MRIKKTDFLTVFYIFHKRKVNRYRKSIDLRTIFKKNLWEKKKTIDFFTNFYISYNIKVVSKSS